MWWRRLSSSPRPCPRHPARRHLPGPESLGRRGPDTQRIGVCGGQVRQGLNDPVGVLPVRGHETRGPGGSGTECRLDLWPIPGCDTSGVSMTRVVFDIPRPSALGSAHALVEARLPDQLKGILEVCSALSRDVLTSTAMTQLPPCQKSGDSSAGKEQHDLHGQMEVGCDNRGHVFHPELPRLFD